MKTLFTVVFIGFLAVSAYCQVQFKPSLGLSYLQAENNEAVGFIMLELESRPGNTSLRTSLFYQSILLDIQPRHLALAGFSVGAAILTVGENELTAGFRAAVIAPSSAGPVIYPYIEWAAPGGAFRVERLPYKEGLINAGLIFHIKKPGRK